MHLADLTSYVRVQEQASSLYQQPDAWSRKAIANVAHSGTFSSDRTITEYARAIWRAEPCPVDQT
jgi:starch phosphorylase